MASTQSVKCAIFKLCDHKINAGTSRAERRCVHRQLRLRESHLDSAKSEKFITASDVSACSQIWSLAASSCPHTFPVTQWFGFAVSLLKEPLQIQRVNIIFPLWPGRIQSICAFSWCSSCIWDSYLCGARTQYGLTWVNTSGTETKINQIR